MRLSKILLFLLTVGTAAIGVGFAQIIPLQNLDWQGLFQGRNPQAVFAEGLGRRLTQPYQILVMGIDEGNGWKGRSDTILLVRLDPSDRQARILSIPRDTRVNMPGYGIGKINAANVYGGIDLAIATMQTKLNNIKIDRYVQIDSSGLKDVIDAIGGIEIDVPTAMQYEDKTQKLRIDLQPGWQTLNGEQAVGFTRWRGDNQGDLGRMQRQQTLIQSLKLKLTNPLVLVRLPQLINVLQANTKTDLNFDEILAIAAFVISLPTEAISTQTLNGIPSAPYAYYELYWLANQDDVDQAIRGKFVTID